MPRTKRVNQTPRYRDAVEWIAQNDNAGAGDGVRTIQGYVSTLLVADLFGADPWHVAVDVERRRHKLGLPVQGGR